MEDQQRLRNVRKLVHEVMPKNPYHNIKHVMSVYSAVNRLTEEEGVEQADKFLLRTTSLLHDIIYVIGRTDNEERSAEFSALYLPGLLYSPEEIKVITRLILTTKMPQKPGDYLERIICDADLDNLGRRDFFERGEEIRKECGIEPGKVWYELQLKFLLSHRYHTEVARRLREKGKQKNINKLEKFLGGVPC